MGLWITFVFVMAVFALMGWSLYQTHRRSPVETLQESKAFVVGRLDAIDVVVVLVTWFAFPFVFGSWFDPLMSDRRTGFGLFLVCGSGAVWLRRRFLPGTVIRFDPKNLALRCGSVVCGLASPVALLFGFAARWLEQSSFLAWSFFLTAGGLAVLAVGLHAIEFRRRPRLAQRRLLDFE